MPQSDIYLNSWPPWVAQGTRDWSINILRGNAVLWIDFSFCGFRVQPADFEAVAVALEQCKILVEIDYGAYSRGEYQATNSIVNGYQISGKLILGSGTCGFHEDSQKALMIHEATHAAMDLKSKGSMTMMISECLAYIAQQIFHKMVSTQYLTGTAKFDAAKACAESYLKGQYPADKSISALAEALSKDPEYGLKTYYTKTGFDG